MSIQTRLAIRELRKILSTLVCICAFTSAWYFTIYKRIASQSSHAIASITDMHQRASQAPDQTVLAEAEQILLRESPRGKGQFSLPECVSQAHKWGVHLAQAQLIHSHNSQPIITLQLQAKYKALQNMFADLQQRTHSSISTYDLIHESSGLFTLNCSLEKRS